LTAILLLALAAVGAPPARYNEAVPPSPRAPLVAHIEELARKLARRAPPSGPPPNELVEASLWLHGIVEPPPHLIVVTMTTGSDEAALLDELRAQLPRVLGSGSYRRVGVAAEAVDGQTNVVLALQESFVELKPLPRALPADGAVALEGRIRAPYVRPEVLVTAPNGQVSKLFVAARDDVSRFTATLRCFSVGRHQVEITGDDRYGPAVLANFPVDCGVPAPMELIAGHRQVEEPAVSDAGEAEASLARLVNADRTRAGLPPLKLDARLSRVARAHSEDMVRGHFVGHVSPTTGSAADRLKVARLPAQLVLENVARAYSPSEVERGLMDSPGHRANLLNREVGDFGVGVALGDLQSGVREIFATQLFIRAPEQLPADATADLMRRIAELRHARSLAPLSEDPALDRVAADTADGLARGRLTSADAKQPLERALPSFSGRYRAVHSGVAVVSDLPQAVTSLDRPLSDSAASGVGVGVARSGDQVYVVILLGSR
jgi:uncharacterized protein YkwD